jgi:hypothetical protein
MKISCSGFIENKLLNNSKIHCTQYIAIPINGGTMMFIKTSLSFTSLVVLTVLLLFYTSPSLNEGSFVADTSLLQKLDRLQFLQVISF